MSPGETETDASALPSAEGAGKATEAFVDAHTHLLPPRLARAIRGFFDAHLPFPYPYPVDWEEVRSRLVTSGARRIWTLPYAHKAGMAEGLNRWMAETFGDDPVVEPGACVHPEDDVGEVVAQAHALGLRLWKLHCSVGGFPPDEPRLEPLWRAVSEGGQVVTVHVGRAIDGTTAADEVARLGGVVRRWPSARIVVAHAGSPGVEATLALLRAHPNVHADLTPVVTRPVTVPREALLELHERILFGSDAPNVALPVEGTLAALRRLELPEAVERAVLRGNAERLLPNPRA